MNATHTDIKGRRLAFLDKKSEEIFIFLDLTAAAHTRVTCPINLTKSINNPLIERVA